MANITRGVLSFNLNHATSSKATFSRVAAAAAGVFDIVSIEMQPIQSASLELNRGIKCAKYAYNSFN